MSAERATLESGHDDDSRHRTEGWTKPKDFNDSKAPADAQSISASVQEADRDSEGGQNQGSGEQSGPGEGDTSNNAEPNVLVNAPDAPVDIQKTQIDYDEDEDEDEDESDDDDFPRNEDVPRGRIVGPVAGQRPPKPR